MIPLTGATVARAVTLRPRRSRPCIDTALAGPAWLRISDPLKSDLIALRLLGRTRSALGGPVFEPGEDG